MFRFRIHSNITHIMKVYLMIEGADTTEHYLNISSFCFTVIKLKEENVSEFLHYACFFLTCSCHPSVPCF
jgi:hypothetical protein